MKSEIYTVDDTPTPPALPVLMEWIDPVKDINRVLIVLFVEPKKGMVVYTKGCSGRRMGEISTFADYSDKTVWKLFKGTITLQND